MIVKCTCTHKYQDETHGKAMRVANPTIKVSGDKIIHRCTVCHREQAK